MMDLFSEKDTIFKTTIIEPLTEMAAYEALWEKKSASFKNMANLFKEHPNKLPSELVDDTTLTFFKSYIKESIVTKPDFINHHFGLFIRSSYDYPKKLRDAEHPVEVLYYKGNPALISTPSIAVVGTRKPTDEGIARTRKLVKALVNDGYTIASGLAEGIDTVAHETAIKAQGKTIAVIGTALDSYYPKQNQALQDYIAKNFLVISQIPFWRYKRQNPSSNRFFFPERNKTMSAISEATVIVEAGETSGTLIQARAALYQKRKLFILDSCFRNPNITWPARFAEKGAIRVKDITDIQRVLGENVS